MHLLEQGQIGPRRRMHIIENYSIVAAVIASTDFFGIDSTSYSQRERFQSQLALPAVDIFPPLELGAARLARWTPSRSVRACLSILRQVPIDPA